MAASNGEAHDTQRILTTPRPKPGCVELRDGPTHLAARRRRERSQSKSGAAYVG